MHVASNANGSKYKYKARAAIVAMILAAFVCTGCIPGDKAGELIPLSTESTIEAKNSELDSMRKQIEDLNAQLLYLKEQAGKTPAPTPTPSAVATSTAEPSPTMPVATSTPMSDASANELVDEIYSLGEAQNMMWDFINQISKSNNYHRKLYTCQGIRKEKNNTLTLMMDEVEWLTGDAAKQAFAKDTGEDAAAVELENGFYISNPEVMLELYPVKKDLQVLTYDRYHNFLTKDDIIAFLSKQADETFGLGVYDVFIENNNVKFMIQRYIP